MFVPKCVVSLTKTNYSKFAGPLGAGERGKEAECAKSHGRQAGTADGSPGSLAECSGIVATNNLLFICTPCTKKDGIAAAAAAHRETMSFCICTWV